MKVRRIALLGLLTALSLVLGWVERLLPLPGGLPGMKLGLANLAVLLALYGLDSPSAGLLVLLKVSLSALLFSNGLTALVYSAAGAILSFAGMLLLRKWDRYSVVTVSAAGGVLHNIGQLLAAMAVTRTAGLWSLAPMLAASGLGSGLLLGIAARGMQPMLRRFSGTGERK
jgi:heptaprenyl diphosphate synthase